MSILPEKEAIKNAQALPLKRYGSLEEEIRFS
jgi:hypothetical protein